MPCKVRLIQIRHQVHEHQIQVSVSCFEVFFLGRSDTEIFLINANREPCTVLDYSCVFDCIELEMILSYLRGPYMCFEAVQSLPKFWP